MERRLAVSMTKPWTRHFRVLVVNRKQGLQPGESMSDIAGHLARAIDADLGGPVVLTGTSTGGSVALQLAADRRIWCGRWWWWPRRTGSGRSVVRCNGTWRALPGPGIQRVGSPG